MHGTFKPKANQVRGSKSKESFRDFLGSSVIIHQISDGKERGSTYMSMLYLRVLSLSVFIDLTRVFTAF